MKKITRFVKDLGRGINSLCLCARFPFLYPRNRFTGLHWNNWKINDKLHELYNQSELTLWVTVKPFEEKIGSEVISDITVLDYIKNKKYNTYKIQASDHTHYEIINKYNGKIMSILDINDFLEKTENCKTNDPSLLDTVLVWNAHEIKTNQWVKRNPKLPKYNYGLTLYYNSDNLKIKEDVKHIHKIKINKIAALKRNILKWIYENPLQYIFFWPTYNELDALEPGWRKVFGIQICKEIRHALYQNGGLKAIFNYRIMQIKEKFGFLHWYDVHSYQDVYAIISKYEDLSTKICICCGKPAEYMSRGWISYYCADCINKDNIDRYKKLNDKNEEEDELF